MDFLPNLWTHWITNFQGSDISGRSALLLWTRMVCFWISSSRSRRGDWWWLMFNCGWLMIMMKMKMKIKKKKKKQKKKNMMKVMMMMMMLMMMMMMMMIMTMMMTMMRIQQPQGDPGSKHVKNAWTFWVWGLLHGLTRGFQFLDLLRLRFSNSTQWSGVRTTTAGPALLFSSFSFCCFHHVSHWEAACCRFDCTSATSLCRFATCENLAEMMRLQHHWFWMLLQHHWFSSFQQKWKQHSNPAWFCSARLSLCWRTTWKLSENCTVPTPSATCAQYTQRLQRSANLRKALVSTQLEPHVD